MEYYRTKKEYMSKQAKTKSENLINKDLANNKGVFNETILFFFLICILLIDFLPQFSSVEITAPQFSYLSVINIITGIFILKNQDFIANSLITLFEKSIVLKGYIAFLFFCCISLFFARNFSLAIVSFMNIVTVFCMFINLCILLHNKLDLIFKIAFIIGISVLVQTYLELNHFIGVAKSNSIVDALAELKGNTGNINIFAASLVGKIPFLLIGITYFSKWKRGLLILSLFLASLLIFLTASRASYLGLFIEMIVFIVVYLKIHIQKKPNYIYYVAIIIPLLIAFFTANIIFEKGKDNTRYQSVTTRVLQIGSTKTEDASINARLTFWDNAVQIIKANPVLGIGLGNWKIDAMPYEKTQANNLIISDHPHNDFLEIAAETGIINACIYLLIFIFGLIINVKTILKNPNYEARIIACLALLLLITYGIDATFNFPLYRPTMQLNFCFFLALTILNSNSIEKARSFNYKSLGTIGIISVSILTFYFSFSTFKAYQLINDTRIDLAQEETNYKYTAQEIINRIPNFPNTQTNSQPFIELAAIYSLKEKKYPEALKYFNLSQKINPYTGRAEWYKYRIYKELGNQDSAYYYAKKALELRPRNESYYFSGIEVEVAKKDTVAILKVHDQFTQYIKKPNIWINTSSALALSQYSNKGLIQFIDSGLALFQNDTTLLNRKKSFQNDAKKTTQNTIKKAEAFTTNTINLGLASQYAAERNYEKALVYYKKALQQDLNNIIITQNIGICYFKINQYKTAIVYLEKTLNSPTLTDGKTEYLLGAAYLNTQNTKKGCENLNAAEKKNYPGAAELVVQYCK